MTRLYHKINIMILYSDMGAKGSKQEMEEYGSAENVVREPRIRRLYDEGEGKYSTVYEGDPLTREEQLQQIMFEANENTKSANQMQEQPQFDKAKQMRESYASLPKNSTLDNMKIIARTTVNEGGPSQLSAMDFIEEAAKDESKIGVQGRRDAIRFLEEAAQRPDRLLSIRATKFLVYMMDSSRFTRAERKNAERVLTQIATHSKDSERGKIANSALFSQDNPLLSMKIGGKRRNTRRKTHQKSRRKQIRRLKRTNRK